MIETNRKIGRLTDRLKERDRKEGEKTNFSFTVLLFHYHHRQIQYLPISLSLLLPERTIPG